MTRKLFASVLFIIGIAGLLFWMSGCKKDETTEPLEPISLIQPDSSIVRLFAGDSLPIEIKFTTDRPINWIKGMYDIDTLGNPGYAPTYPDTLFYMALDTLDPRVNRYTYTGTYYVPDNLPPYSTVRFRAEFEAGKSTFTVGQNYPAGIVTGDKQFRIDVR